MGTLVKYTNGYTVVDNRLLLATNLSLKAKAMYIYLDSKPNRWNFSVRGIASEMKEGRDTVNSVLNELEELKLLKRRQLKTGDETFGRMVYCLYNPVDSAIVTNRFGQKSYGKKTKTVKERQEIFRKKCLEVYETKKDRMSHGLAKQFYEYWTEQTYAGKTMRFETQTAFDISRRMDTFIRNEKKFGKTNNKKELSTKNT